MENEFERLEELLNEKADITPDSSTINRLHEKLHEKRSPETAGIFSVKIPLWTAAAVVFLVVLTMSVLSNRTVEPTVVEKVVVMNDTIFVTKRDTIRIERVMYRDRTPAKIIRVKKVDTGSSMKDKEELQNLLVSGSD